MRRRVSGGGRSAINGTVWWMGVGGILSILTYCGENNPDFILSVFLLVFVFFSTASFSPSFLSSFFFFLLFSGGEESGCQTSCIYIHRCKRDTNRGPGPEPVNNRTEIIAYADFAVSILLAIVVATARARPYRYPRKIFHLNQRLPPKHPLPHLPNHIPPIMPSNQHNPTASPPHPPHPPQSVDEIYTRMRHVVEDDVFDG